MADIVAQFEISMTRVLDPSGKQVGVLAADYRKSEQLLALYRTMVLTRAFDTRAVKLQRTGRLGTFPSSLGQEAVGAGIGVAMNPEDVLLPSYREHGAMIGRGVSMLEQLLYWGGDERGSDFAVATEDFPICIPIATQVIHAAGVATAFKLRNQPRVAVTVLGDGATSKGDFAEAMNLAGVWNLPLVFVVTNNQWAISVPRAQQSGAQTLAQKAIAAGIPGCQVDGNDALGVYQAIRSAVETARVDRQPAVIEALTYRLGDHTTADDAKRYRSEQEVTDWWARDPIPRLRSYLLEQHLWSKEDEELLARSCESEVNQAVDDYLATPPPKATEMFDHLYETLPRSLQSQRDELKEVRDE